MLVTTKRISRPFGVASIRAQASRDRIVSEDFALCSWSRRGSHAGAGRVKRPDGWRMSSKRPIDQPVEHGVAGQAKDKIDAVLIAPLHHLGAAVMAVAPDGDPGLGPVPADAADEMAQGDRALPRSPEGALAGTQHCYDRFGLSPWP